MMPRSLKFAFIVLAGALLVGLISLREMHQRMKRLSETESSEERARQEVLAPPISTPTDVTVQARVFWAAGPDQVAPVEVALPLSADPVQRSRQLVRALIALPPTPAQRTLPADATLLGFYILPDGTAIADFSDTLASGTPSGIMSEQLAVNSLARTLAANVPTLRRLKILIHGQEAETLAGNVDLTGYFELNSATPSTGSAASGVAPTPPAGATQASAPTAASR